MIQSPAVGHVAPHGKVEVVDVDRKHVLDSSLDQLFNSSQTVEDFAQRGIGVSFANEYGSDAGGPTKEFMTLALPEILRPPVFHKQSFSREIRILSRLGRPENGGQMEAVSSWTTSWPGCVLGRSFPCADP